MIAVAIIGFLVIFAIVVGSVIAGTRYLEKARKKQVATMLQAVAGEGPSTQANLLKATPKAKSEFETALAQINIAKSIRLKISQADLTWSVQSFFVFTLVGAVGGALAGSRLHASPAGGSIIAGLIGSVLPYMILMKKRGKRLAALETQLPEALDFLARSMRAGHALTVSLNMVGEELPEPMGREFRTLAHEQNLGAPMDIALENLCTRVPLLDLQFFSSALLLQRQTGGNLSEILRQLANLIRERFRLKGQVKALSAHGRMTSGVLIGLPIVTCVLLTLVAPEYLGGMAKDPDGKKLIVAAIVMQFIGAFVIRKIIRIQV